MAADFSAERIRMSFKVRIVPSGREFGVEEGEAVLTAALRQGLALPYSCRNGVCGSCKGRVLSGRVDYGGREIPALTDDEKRAGKALFCQAHARSDLVIEVREVARVADIPVKILPCRVMTMERAAPDVMILQLTLPQNERLQYLAGQYLDILLRDGARRSFSIANPPGRDEHLELHVRQVPGGRFTTHVFEKMKEKDLLRFQGPLGTFFLRDDAQGSASAAGDTTPGMEEVEQRREQLPRMSGAAEEPGKPAILIAGGTGFAPMQAIIENEFVKGSARPLHLYWGARARQDLYRHGRAEAWTQQHPGFRYTPVLSQPLPADGWAGRTGWVHEAVLADYPDLSGVEVYASGPPAMITAIRAHVFAHGLKEENLYSDSFEYAHPGT
jgi:CDP-4-dehydro-6-deoxyglucose reductase